MSERPENWKELPLDDLLAVDAITPTDLVQMIVDDLYSGLRQYCEIPELYNEAQLAYEQLGIESMSEDEIQDLIDSPPGSILDPELVQVKSIEFCRAVAVGSPRLCHGGSAFTPKFGAAFVGPPGTGKTHIMAALGRKLKEQLDTQLGNIKTLAEATTRKIVEGVRLGHAEKHGVPRLKLDDASSEAMMIADVAGKGLFELASGEDSGIVAERPTAAQCFEREMDELKRKVRSWPYLPTDVLFMTFDSFFEFYQRQSERAGVLEAIVQAKILFMDDLHDKGDPMRRQAIQHLIERRYEAGRFGTFFTTNLGSDELGGGDKCIKERLASRGAASILSFDFEGCKDWRQKVQNRRLALVDEELTQLAEKALERLRGTTGV